MEVYTHCENYQTASQRTSKLRVSQGKRKRNRTTRIWRRDLETELEGMNITW